MVLSVKLDDMSAFTVAYHRNNKGRVSAEQEELNTECIIRHLKEPQGIFCDKWCQQLYDVVPQFADTIKLFRNDIYMGQATTSPDVEPENWAEREMFKWGLYEQHYETIESHFQLTILFGCMLSGIGDDETVIDCMRRVGVPCLGRALEAFIDNNEVHKKHTEYMKRLLKECNIAQGTGDYRKTKIVFNIMKNNIMDIDNNMSICVDLNLVTEDEYKRNVEMLMKDIQGWESHFPLK